MQDLSKALAGLDSKKRELLALLAKRGGIDLSRAPIAPVSRESGPLPLSFAQERIWFLDQLDPGGSSYNLPSATGIYGRLDFGALLATFEEIVRRHEVLRTTFPSVAGKPVQKIAPPGPVPIPLIDLSALPDPEKEALRLKGAQAHQPFDLEHGPLLRPRLVWLARDRYLLLTTVHHVISDGWSSGIMVREVAEIYQAFVEGRPSPLPELAIQYADFSHWQRQALQGPVLGSQLDYWKSHLRDLPPPLALPVDRPRLGARGQQAHQQLALTTSGIGDEVRSLARKEEATLFMFLAALCLAFLHRLTGQDDLTLGTPVAGRNRVETEPLVGLFINTLVLRSDLRDAPPEGLSFREILARTRKEAVGAFGNQDVPFEKLVEELQPERDLSRTPIFQAMFVLQNTPAATSLELPGITLESSPSGATAALFDLTFVSAEGEEGDLGVTIVASTDLFEAPTVVRMARRLLVLLEGILATPDVPLSSLPLLTADELQQILVDWNQVSRSGLDEAPLHRLFEVQAARAPERTAVTHGSESLTYGELNRRANRLAHHLKSLGVGPEHRVGLCAQRSLDLIVGLLGILKTGGAYVPIDPEFPAERRALLLEDAGVKVLVGSLDDLPGSIETDPPIPVSEGNLAYVIYTSGSTGRPKGVQVTHGNVTRLFAAAQPFFHFGPDDVWTLFHSYAFDFSVWEIWGALLYGGRLVVVPSETARDPEAFLDLLAAERVTVLNQTPSAFAALARIEEESASPRDLAALRWVLFGGEALEPARLEPWFRRHGDGQPRLVNLYGITETTVHVTVRPLAQADARSGQGSRIGRPLSDLHLYVLDRWLDPAPIGVPGELCVSGTGLARGYLGRPDLTAERFVPDPWSGEPGARLYRSGDLGRLHPDGDIEYLGRIDQQVKIRGYRIEPGEIEAALLQHPEVSEAVVLALGAREDTRLSAYVASRNGLNPEDLRSFLERRLPGYMVPSAFAVLDELPLTPHGKVDRRALSRLGLETGPVEATYVAPRTPDEEVIASLFAELLGKERVGAHDNFFTLGGHSLLAGLLAARIRDRFDSPLPLRHVFESPTPAGLVQAVEALRDAKPGSRPAPPPLRPAPTGAEIPLSFAQQRLWFLDRMEPGSPFYNVALALRLGGDVDPAALERCLEEIQRRHGILRTSYPTQDGRARVVVDPPGPRPLPRVDLSGLPNDERLPEAKRLAAREALRPFDLSRGPLFRTTLLHLSEAEHAFFLTLHHIIADGWSLGVLLRELGTLYDAFRAGRTSPLPELPVQYSDFAWWQREWLEGANVLEEQLAYWRKQLAGGLAPLDLPGDRPRPPVQTHRGAVRLFSVGRNVTDRLAALAGNSDATLFMVLLAALQALLHRYTGREDVTVGSPTAGLGSAQAEALIGLFTNMLVLRTDLSGDPSFLDLLGRVHETALGAFYHADVPFERLVDELQPERDISRSPLFQVMFAFQNTPKVTLDLPGLSPRLLETGRATSRFDLTLELVEGSAGLGGYLEYNTDLFDAPTISRLGDHLSTLLEGIVEGPERRLSDLPLWTVPERHQALVEWNDTALPMQAETIHGRIESQIARSFDATALVSGNRRLSYAELEHEASHLARRLRALGVGPGDRVGICLRRSPELVVGLLGILKAGAAYVPLDPAYPDERLVFVLEDAGLRAAVAETATADRFADRSVPVVRVDVTEEAPHLPLPASDPALPAYVIYTSGSTGRPKGVVVCHANVLNFFAAMDAVLAPPSPLGTWLAVTSVAFDISVLELLWTLTRGFEVVIQTAPDETPARRRRRAAPARPLDFSLFYFAADESEGSGDRYRLLLEGARFADRHGFSAVWTPERHFHAFGGLYPNPAVTAAAVAGVTERVQIRAGSVVLPLHKPIRVAEEWALVDNLSGGRVGISFASGWHVNDFVLAPDNFRTRKEVMLREIETVRRLWQGEPARVPDGAGSPVEVRVFPRPVRPELPVWVTAAGSPDTFRAAGEIGAGVLTHLLGQNLDDLAGKIAIYREAFRQSGREGDGHVVLMLHAFVGDDLEEVRETVRGPFKSYLRSSLGLLRELMRGLGAEAVDLDALTEAELDPLLTHAFERYFETAGLMGTPDSCMEMVDRLAAIGIDEAACLIDFGVETETALAALEGLDEVRRRSQRAAEPETQPEDGEDASFADQMRRHGVTHLQATPSLAGMLAADPESLETLEQLHTLLLGGEALPASLASRLPSELAGGLRNLYGPTETTIWSTTHRLNATDLDSGGTVTIGRPLANNTVHLVDPRSLRPLPIGVPGELLIGGDGVAQGYLDRPDLTAERFIPDSFSGSPGARLYRTGDLARYLPDGRIDFRGRLDHQVKVRGYRIEPGEVEAALLQHSAVRESVVVARRAGGPDGEVRLVAYLVPQDGKAEEISVAALRSFLEERLPEPSIPSAFVVLEALPLTPNGKIDRRALPSPDAGRLAVSTTWVAPKNELERAIAGVWQEVLGLERVGAQDNFFELGGTSFTLAQVHSRLRADLGRDLAMIELFRHPTVSALARSLGEDGTAAPRALDEAQARGGTRAELMEQRRQARQISRVFKEPA